MGSKLGDGGARCRARDEAVNGSLLQNTGSRSGKAVAVAGRFRGGQGAR